MAPKQPKPSNNTSKKVSETEKRRKALKEKQEIKKQQKEQKKLLRKQLQAEREKKAQEEQARRKDLIQELERKIRENDWKSLIAGEADKEIATSFSEYDKRQLMKKARCVVNVLREQCAAAERNDNVSWAEICDKAAAELNFGEFCGSTVANWYKDLHANQAKGLGRTFTAGRRGRYSPFANNPDIQAQFRDWAASNWSQLSVRKAKAWIQSNVLSQLTQEQLRSHRISRSRPVSDKLVTVWMKEAGVYFDTESWVFRIKDYPQDPAAAVLLSSTPNITQNGKIGQNDT